MVNKQHTFDRSRMWSQTVLCLLVGLAYASQNPGWDDNYEYVYQVRGRTFASLNQLSNDYTGILLKAKLYLKARSDGNLDGKIEEPQYAQIQNQLDEGWETYIPDSEVSYNQLQISPQPFQVVMNNGAIRDVIVSKEVENWEVNFIKSVVSQFQLDTEAKNLIKSHINILTQEGTNTAVYKTMEETVTGVSETLYEIHPLPEYILQSQPWLVPLEELARDGEIIEVAKSKNFTNSDEYPSYHFGLHGIRGYEPANKVGEFFFRTSETSAIITGALNDYTIQSVITVDNIYVRPTLTDKQKGSVNSRFNVTLISVRQQNQQYEEISNPVNVGVVYRYNGPYDSSNEARPGKEYEHKPDAASYESQDPSTHGRSKRAISGSRPYLSRPFGYEHSVSSEEEYSPQEQPKLNEEPASPLLPFTVGYDGQSYKKKQNIVENVRKLAQEIGQEFQRPEEIQKQNTVGKYVILASLLRTMNQNEMQEAANQLYSNKRRNDQAYAWKVYRDAVAQAGTGPALIIIKDWIKSDKISEREAAQIVSTAAESARQPTEEYMKAFFEMIRDDKIMSQVHLNETVLLTYTTLVHHVYVNREDSHNKYPVHSFGTFRSEAGKTFVKTEVIPYLTQKLHNAVTNCDTQNIHAYIRALGNVGHQHILEAYEPYLEGQKKASQFQRLLMVIALNKLVISNPKVARSVLFKIYQNPGEDELVRVAAVYQLMRANPPPSMLQHMAYYTNYDPSHYVNAAVKSVIVSASQLKGQKFVHLRAGAESAKALLTSQQYGAQYSHNKLRNYVAEQMKFSYLQNAPIYGSEDYIIPKGFRYDLRGRFGGFKQQIIDVQAMVSSIDDLVNVFQQQTEEYQQQQNEKQSQEPHKFSSESIAQLLNMENDQREQLEGFMRLKFGALLNMWSYDNQTIENLPEAIQTLEETLKNGENYDYGKMVMCHEVAVSFPTILGLPFIYTYDVPTFIKFEGTIKASASPQISSGDKIRLPNTIESEFEINAYISARSQSQHGFVTPFDHQRYRVGYNKNLQVTAPVSGNIKLDTQNHQLTFELQNLRKQNVPLLHYSTKPYIVKSDVYQPKPDRQFIRKKHPQQINTVFGQKYTGIAFNFQMTSDQHLDFASIYEKLYHRDMVSTLLSPWIGENIQYTEVNVAIDSDKSLTDQMTVQLGYQHKYDPNKKPASSNPGAAVNALNNISEEPLKRQKQFLKRSSADIKSVRTHVVDANVIFKGQNEIKYCATVALAKSNADPKSRVLAKLMKNGPQDQQWQFALSAVSHIPNINGLDLNAAMELDPKPVTEVEVSVGETDLGKISAHFELSKSQERKQHLTEQPDYEECQRQMQEGNYQLPVCAKMTARANLLDQFAVNIQYDNLDNHVYNYTYKLYSILRHRWFPRFEENIVEDSNSGENNVAVEGQFSPDLSAVNVSVVCPYGRIHVKNVKLNEWAKHLFVPHPVFHAKSRLMSHVYKYDTYRPICVVDKVAASTFDNKTYPLDLGNSWTVLMQYVPRRPSSNPDQIDQPVPEQLKENVEGYAVLVRTSEQQSSQKEVKIVVQTPYTKGKPVEINLKPGSPSPSVYVDKEEVKYKENESSDFYNGYIQIYGLPNNEVKFEIYQTFYVIYDGVRVKLADTDGSKFRDASRGLCGTYTGEPETDFVAPNNCILRSAQDFVSSYSLEAQQRRRIARMRIRDSDEKCYQKNVQYVNVISSADAGRDTINAERLSRSSCTRLQTQYVEQGGETCFTLRPLPICKQGCQQRGLVSKNVPVHCVRSTGATNLWKNEIRKGASPDFSLKHESRTIRMELPKKCVA